MSTSALPALLDPAALIEPVAAGTPCGPDLDAASDPDFLNLVARLEGLLPTTFFTRDDEGRSIPFDRTTINAKGELAGIARLLADTRDLRLVTLAARLSILDRDLSGFAFWLKGVAVLLAERWDDVHPRSEDGDHSLRLAVLQALDDAPTIILPLQYVTLAESRRFGSISYRRFMAAAGEASSSEESPLDRPTLDRAIAEEDPEVRDRRRASLVVIREAAAAIRQVTTERTGPSDAVTLERLSDLTERMLAVLGAAAPATEAEPSGQIAGSASPAPVPAAGAAASALEAARALAAAAGYFAGSEPSCPAALLLAQARQLVGRSFAEAVAILVPAHADLAHLRVGLGNATFDLPLAHLAGLAAPDSTGPPEDEEAPPAATRAEAVGLMRAAAAFYRDAEPSSPIPLLLDRACALVNRDFLSLLRDALPEDALERSKA